jgi:hypothetical protein
MVEFIRHRTNLFYKKGSKLKKQFSHKKIQRQGGQKRKGVGGKEIFARRAFLPPKAG